MAGYAVPFPGEQQPMQYAHSPQPVYAQMQPAQSGYAPSHSPYPQQIQMAPQPGVQYVQQPTQYVQQQQPQVQYVPVSPNPGVQYASQPMQVMQAPPMSPQPPGAPAGGQQVKPGDVTYTTSTGPDGRTVYNQFKAVAAAYQTPQGVVTGIQWIPAEATSVLPQNAQPANAEFAASWNRGPLGRDEERSMKEWQRDEEKRRRKEDKAAAKRLDKWERERRDRELAEEREEMELRRARERDGVAGSRMRRKSFNAGAVPNSAGLVGGFGQVPSGVGVGGYGTAAPFPSSGYERDSDLERRFETLGLGPERDGYEPERAKRERRMSTGFALPRSRKNSVVNFDDRPRRPLDDEESLADYPPGGGAGYAASGGSGVYPGSGYVGSRTAPSPYHAGGALPPGGYTGSYSGSEGSAGRADYGYARGEAGYGREGVPARSGSMYGAEGVPVRSGSMYAGEGGHARSSSMYGGEGGHARSGSMYGGEQRVYPAGHILEGQPIPGGGVAGSGSGAPYGGYPSSRPPSRGAGGYPVRPASRNSYAAAPGGAYPAPAAYPTSRPPSRLAGSNMPQPGYGVQPPDVLDTPEGFRRQPNLAVPYTPFETLKIQDLDDFADHIPRMPAVLTPHDVYDDDWIRFMHDVALAWEGKLPTPDQRARRRSSILIDLVELWNTSFFLPRGTEVVLYKGRERRTGVNAGTYDPNLPMLDEAELRETDSESEDDSEDEEEERRMVQSRFAYGGGSYSRQYEAQLAEAREARRRRRERKLEQRRRDKEKKLRRKVKERERKYMLYLSYVPLREGSRYQ